MKNFMFNLSDGQYILLSFLTGMIVYVTCISIKQHIYIKKIKNKK